MARPGLCGVGSLHSSCRKCLLPAHLTAEGCPLTQRGSCQTGVNLRPAAQVSGCGFVILRSTLRVGSIRRQKAAARRRYCSSFQVRLPWLGGHPRKEWIHLSRLRPWLAETIAYQISSLIGSLAGCLPRPSLVGAAGAKLLNPALLVARPLLLPFFGPDVFAFRPELPENLGSLLKSENGKVTETPRHTTPLLSCTVMQPQGHNNQQLTVKGKGNTAEMTLWEIPPCLTRV